MRVPNPTERRPGNGQTSHRFPFLNVMNPSTLAIVTAVAAAIAVGIAAAAGAVSMGLSISKSAESIARQPEAAGNIRASLMLGLVFIETAIIYALIVGILIIFVL